MQTNNNPIAEIGVVLIALGFIAAGTTLLALRIIDLNVAIILWTLAGSVAGINVALKAPSPTQQQLLAQALQAQAQPAQLVQAPAPVATPQVVQVSPAASTGATTVPATFTTGVNPQFAPAMSTMPQAIQTTREYPAAPKP